MEYDNITDTADLRLTIPEVAPTEASTAPPSVTARSSASRFLKSRRLKLHSRQTTKKANKSASRFLKSRRLKRGDDDFFEVDGGRLTIPEVAPTEACLAR